MNCAVLDDYQNVALNIVPQGSFTKNKVKGYDSNANASHFKIFAYVLYEVNISKTKINTVKKSVSIAKLIGNTR